MSSTSPLPACSWATDPNPSVGRDLDPDATAGLHPPGQLPLPWDAPPDTRPAPLESPPRPPSPAAGANPTAIAQRWALAVVEALNGRRAHAQLVDRCEADVLDVLRRRGAACRAAGGAQLASIRVQAGSSQTMEVCLRLVVADRVRAAALALGWRDDHWHAEELVVG